MRQTLPGRRSEQTTSRGVSARALRNWIESSNSSALPPVVAGAALVIPAGLLDALRALTDRRAEPPVHAKATERIERLAVDAVLAAET